MKRLIVSGLPCPPEAWESFLGASSATQHVLSMADVFENCESTDLREMSRYVSKQILAYQPDSILCHGLGASMTLLSLLRLRRKGIRIQTKVTLFNSALRSLNLLKANHPLRIQFMSVGRATAEVKALGGVVDPRLRAHYKKIRAMYRKILIFNFVESISSILHVDHFVGRDFSSPIGVRVQMIASANDPYIPMADIKQLRHDFRINRFYECRYGHFPYSGDRSEILPLIENFEKASANEGKRIPLSDLGPLAPGAPQAAAFPTL